MVAQAQIPAEVKDILKKCGDKSHFSGGAEIDIKLHVGAVIASMNGTMKVCKKGDKSFSVVKMKVLGHEIYTETGFDGTDSWEISHSSKGDTITFTHGDKRKKSDGNLNLDLDKKYRKAKMKLKDGYYEISFSEPRDKDNEVKSVNVKISEKNYVMREIRSGARGAKVTMTITKIRVGLKDSYFKLDLTKHPDAVVIRK